MKKVLAFLLTAVLVVSASVCVAFAAPSAEAQGIISGIVALDAEKKEVSIKVEKIDAKVEKDFSDVLNTLKKDENDTSLKVVGQYDLEVDGNPEYPLTVTVDVLGISNSSSVYVMVEQNGEIVTVTPEVKDGKIVFQLKDKADKIAIVTDGKTATNVEKENGVLSPQTNDVSVYVAIAAIIALAALVLVPKKVKA